jgi:hypothetical protein
MQARNGRSGAAFAWQISRRLSAEVSRLRFADRKLGSDLRPLTLARRVAAKMPAYDSEPIHQLDTNIHTQPLTNVKEHASANELQRIDRGD